MLNGAPTFLTPVASAPRPHDVRIELPAQWSESVTALPPAPDNRPHSYRAADFDTLVDSPILAGNPNTYPFTVEGTPHALVNIGEGRGLGRSDRGRRRRAHRARAAAGPGASSPTSDTCS